MSHVALNPAIGHRPLRGQPLALEAGPGARGSQLDPASFGRRVRDRPRLIRSDPEEGEAKSRLAGSSTHDRMNPNGARREIRGSWQERNRISIPRHRSLLLDGTNVRDATMRQALSQSMLLVAGSRATRSGASNSPSTFRCSLYTGTLKMPRCRFSASMVPCACSSRGRKMAF
jgi:hypothetical protein